jgi:hypothetical protein
LCGGSCGWEVPRRLRGSATVLKNKQLIQA